MVHAPDRGITQNLDSSDVYKSSWAKNVIDASIVDGCIAGFASQITKVAQDVAVRFTVVFHVVGIEICLVGGFEFKVEITCYENFRRLLCELVPNLLRLPCRLFVARH